MTPKAARTSVARQGSPAGGSGGRREANKQLKRQRIQRAARELFVAKEYGQVTTRQIARRAGVALGTLFLYADDKLDLLFLAVNDELEATLRAAEQAVDAEGGLLDDLVAAFQPFYRYYARQPHLSQTVLREMIFIEKGRQVRRFLALRERLIALCIRIVGYAVARQEIATPQDPAFVGWILFGVYQVELRRWLWIEKSGERSGVARLRRALQLVVRGLREAQPG